MSDRQTIGSRVINEEVLRHYNNPLQAAHAIETFVETGKADWGR